jgi:uncharacterized caspase-like protein
MDTCHSGAMEAGQKAGMTAEDLAATLREASGLYILSSSKGGEVSIENEKFKIKKSDAGHGAFTYALVNGMKGNANYDNDLCITINELFHYVSKEVPELTQGRQHPHQKVTGTDLPLILLH